jgi:glycosyltransferase involved in cell wall biosynthesis
MKSFPARQAVAVLVPEFPTQTHVFFWREVSAWRDGGLRVELLSTRRPPEDACRHDFAQAARAQTTYLFPPKPGATVRLAVSPRRVAAAVDYVVRLSEAGIIGRGRALAMIPVAAQLVDHADRAGITHVHCHSFGSAAHLCALAWRMGGPTYSLTLHGDLPVYGTDHRSKLSGCCAVGCDGPHLVDPLVELGYPRDRILPNWMGVETDKFTPADRPAEGEALRIITVARLNRNKGHRFALQAIAGLAAEGVACRYTLVGEGPYRQEISAEVERLGLADRVRFLGSMGEAAVRDALREHDVFCLPSVGVGEAGPISVMEAMACGLPVVASDIGATSFMVDHGRTGWVVAQEDVAGLTESLRRVSADRAERSRMGNAARRHAVENFDSRRTAIRLLDHLRRWAPAGSIPAP